MPPSEIVCIRHGEKPIPGSYGVDGQGDKNDHSLTTRGWERAGALCGSRLCGYAKSNPPIFVPSYGQETQDHRPYQTVLSLAQLWGKYPDPVCHVGETDKLEAGVLAQDSVVVVCWEHKELAKFVQELTGKRHHWPDERFDLIWLLERETDTWIRKQKPQLLLPGDRP